MYEILGHILYVQADLYLHWERMSESRLVTWYIVFTLSIRREKPDPEVVTFFMLNSADHEIFPANKYENANNSWHFNIY